MPLLSSAWAECNTRKELPPLDHTSTRASCPLGTLLNALHEFDGKGHAEDPGGKGIGQDAEVVRSDILPGIPLPDMVMPELFLCNPQEHVAVAGFRRYRGDLRVDMVLGDLVFLESKESSYLLRIRVLFRHG
jgi:hypothetical protein